MSEEFKDTISEELTDGVARESEPEIEQIVSEPDQKSEMPEQKEKPQKDNSFLKGLFTGLLAACALFGVILAVFLIVGNNRNPGQSNNSGNNGSSAGSDETGGGENVLPENFVKKYAEIKNIVDLYALDSEEEISEEDISDGMFHGYLKSIGDKYSAYYSPREYSELMEDSNGEYGGIGVYLSEEKETGRFIIANTFKDEPGDKAGLKAGDIITHVNDESVEDMTLEDLSEIVKGEVGTTVKLTVYRDGKKLEFTIERKIIELTTVAYEIIEDGKIGYIYIASFDKLTQTQFREALDEIEEKGAKGLVIDIRNNGGGVLNSAIDILDRLLPGGLVLYTESKQGQPNSHEFYSNAEEFYDKPFCVLINEYSASASEVFAGAVQDFGVAKIIGTRSYGKGVIQTIFPLKSVGDGSGIKLTTEKYFTPKGRDIDGMGIEPDIKVEIDETKENKKGNYTYDTQMQEAVKYISENIK